MPDDGDACNGGDERTEAVRERLQAEHRAFLEAVATAGSLTAEAWDGAAAADRAAVVEPFERVLRRTGTLEAAPAVLAAAVDAAGGHLEADPVPSPPYVAVTTRGLVLRATTDVGRVVVTVAPFAVDRDPVRYVHRGLDADDAALLDVAIHR